MVDIITPEDLTSAIAAAAGDRLAMLVDGANAKALRVAPCLGSTDAPPNLQQLAEAKLILFGAISRWVDAGTGAFQQQTAGPFTAVTDTRQRTGYNLWPSEIADLQAICKTGSAGIVAIDTVADCMADHAVICALMFGALYCSCGADVAGLPLYEE